MIYNQKGIDIITFIDNKRKITYDILVKQKIIRKVRFL